MAIITLGSPQNASGGPWSGQSDQDAFFPVSANVSTSAIDITLLFENLITGTTGQVLFSFPGGVNLQTAEFLKINFNSQLSQLLPAICGSGQEIEAKADVIFDDGSHAESPIITFTIVRSPCICTLLGNVFTTLDSFPCSSVDGTIAIQGKLFEVTCSGGLESPFVNQPAAVLVGLTDRLTGIFYQYVAASTDGTGTFSVGFGVKNIAAVVALIPETGAKDFLLEAFFPGSNTHSPSPIFSKPVTISGAQAGSIPCPLGTLLKDTVFATAPQGTTVHLITQGFAGGIPGVSDFNALADQITTKVHAAIISAGTSTEPVTPLEIKVYRGPDVQLPAFFGLASVTSGSFIVVSTAIGSPIAPIIIAAAIIAVAIIILAFFVFLIFSTVKDIIVAGGGSVLTAGAIAITVVAIVGGGIAVYVLTRPRGRRLLA